MDIKISPTDKSSDVDSINSIMRSLNRLEKNSNVRDEVRAVKNLMETIERKLTYN